MRKKLALIALLGAGLVAESLDRGNHIEIPKEVIEENIMSDLDSINLNDEIKEGKYDHEDVAKFSERLIPYKLHFNRASKVSNLLVEDLEAIAARESSGFEKAKKGLDRGLTGIRDNGAFAFAYKVINVPKNKGERGYFNNLREKYPEFVEILAPFFEGKSFNEAKSNMMDAEANIYTSAFYLRYLYDKSGSLDDAIRWYRMGETKGRRLGDRRLEVVENYVRDVNELSGDFRLLKELR